MTQEEEKQIIRVCGPNYKESDIPAYIRRRDFENEMRQVEAEDRMAEEYEDEKYDYHPRPEEEDN